jgi:glycosyl transferase, family 25
MTPTPAGQLLLDTFAHIRIINLPERKDRHREMVAQLARLGMTVDGDKVAFYAAQRFEDAGGFRNVGARGCFHSHLTILEVGAGLDGPLLILEDDADFADGIEPLLTTALKGLNQNDWSIFYGFGDPAENLDVTEGLFEQRPDVGILTTHCIGFTPNAMRLAVPYLRAMAGRPTGSPDGGPMDVDGAYGWLRRTHPQLRTFCTYPAVANQRPSRTDISPALTDRIPGAREARSLARKMKRHFFPVS